MGEIAWTKCAMNLLPVFHVPGCCNETAMEDKVTHILTFIETPLLTSSTVSLTYYLSWNESIVPKQVEYHLLPVVHDRDVGMT